MLLLHADGIAKREWFFAGQHEQSVTLLCDSGFLKSRFADRIVELAARKIGEVRFMNSYVEML